jgi:hypothetical protein
MQGVSMAEFMERLRNEMREVVRDELLKSRTEEMKEKLLSPAEVCKLFIPQITKATLHNWTKQGIVKRYDYGGRVFYRFSEILEAGKTLKKYELKVADAA